MANNLAEQVAFVVGFSERRDGSWSRLIRRDGERPNITLYTIDELPNPAVLLSDATWREVVLAEVEEFRSQVLLALQDTTTDAQAELCQEGQQG